MSHVHETIVCEQCDAVIQTCRCKGPKQERRVPPQPGHVCKPRAAPDSVLTSCIVCHVANHQDIKDKDQAAIGVLIMIFAGWSKEQIRERLCESHRMVANMAASLVPGPPQVPAPPSLLIRECKCGQPWRPAAGLFGTTEETECPACVLRANRITKVVGVTFGGKADENGIWVNVIMLHQNGFTTDAHVVVPRERLVEALATLDGSPSLLVRECKCGHLGAVARDEHDQLPRADGPKT